MVSAASPLGGGSNLPDAATIVHRRRQRGKYDGLDLAWRNRMGSVTLGSRATTAPKLIKGWTNFKTWRGFEIEILNIDLGCVQARSGACDTTTVCLGLFAAHNLHAVREETRSAAADISRNFSRSGCVSVSALEPLGSLAILTSVKGF